MGLPPLVCSTCGTTENVIARFQSDECDSCFAAQLAARPPRRIPDRVPEHFPDERAERIDQLAVELAADFPALPIEAVIVMAEFTDRFIHGTGDKEPIGFLRATGGIR